MAADWRGWRLIVVGGERFRWQAALVDPWIVFAGGRGEQEDFVRVRFEADPSRLLTVNCGKGGVGIILPRSAAEWIAQAQARGWPQTVSRLELSVPVAGGSQPAHTGSALTEETEAGVFGV